jgi:uncharacterized protein
MGSGPGDRRGRAGVARGVLLLVVGVVVLRGLAGWIEPRLVFFPFAGEDATPAGLGIRYDTLRIDTLDGERLVAWQLEPDAPLADVVYFKGNGGNLSVWLPALAALHQQRLRVIAIDYRGYGLSTGRPTEDGVYLDAEATVRYVQQARGSDPAIPLVYWGRSLGGPIAASATRTIVPDGVILESTFPDKASVIRYNPVLRALNVFGRYQFATAEMLRDFPHPVLVMHGDRDEIIPFRLGRELQAQLGDRARFVTIPGGRHNDSHAAGAADYWRGPLDFIRGLPVSRGPDPEDTPPGNR